MQRILFKKATGLVDSPYHVLITSYRTFLEDYFHFWGAYDKHEYVKPCHHNGCNHEKEWIVYLSGTTACLENWEMVTGAFDGGEFTANLVMESLGLDIGEWTQRCYV